MKHKPKCEICKKRKAVCFSYSDKREKWCYTCHVCEPDDYWIPLDDFFKDGLISQTEWINHLKMKSWFDTKDFVATTGRLLEEAIRRNQ